MDTILDFGKYAGKTLKKVSESHGDYILWMMDNISKSKLKEKGIYNEVKRLSEEMDKDTLEKYERKATKKESTKKELPKTTLSFIKGKGGYILYDLTDEQMEKIIMLFKDDVEKTEEKDERKSK